MDCFRAAKVVNTLDFRVVKFGIFMLCWQQVLHTLENLQELNCILRFR